MRVGIQLVSCVLFAGMACCASLGAAEFIPLGDLPGGVFDSSPTDISDDGLTVVGFGISDLGTEAFRWTEDGGLTALSSLTGETVPTIARAVSNTGAIAGQLDYKPAPPGMSQCDLPLDEIPFAAVWTEDFGFLPLGGRTLLANDLSADGTAITGTTCVEDPVTGERFEYPFHWTETGGLFELNHIGQAFGISADGNVVTGFAPLDRGDGTFANQAFIWTPELEGYAEPLGFGADLPFASEAFDISANGEVIVGAYRAEAESVTEGFRWTLENGFEGLGHLVESPSLAFDVSDDGSVIVGEQFLDDTGAETAATIWTAQSGLWNLQNFLTDEMGLGDALSGWTLTRSNGISADGRSLVGYGTNPDGQTEAWLVRIDDFPPSQTIPGDYNDNGRVEQADLDLVLLNWNESVADLPADWINERPTSGIIDQAELDGVLLNWNRTTPGLGAAAAVPEPGTLLLAVALFAGAAAGSAGRRKLPLARMSSSGR